jgi:tRNA modification GTPase
MGAEIALSAAEGAMRSGLAVDMVSTDLQSALISLGETTGLSVNEDIVSEIFSHFCVGK